MSIISQLPGGKKNTEGLAGWPLTERTTLKCHLCGYWVMVELSSVRTVLFSHLKGWDPINIFSMCSDSSLDQKLTPDSRWPICFSLLKSRIEIGRHWSVWVSMMWQNLEVRCTVLNKREVIAPIKACILASSYVQPCADEHSHGIIMTFTSSQGPYMWPF